MHYLVCLSRSNFVTVMRIFIDVVFGGEIVAFLRDS